MLIDKERGYWIDNAIDNNFLAHKAEVIKSIPLCFTGVDDKLYWPSKMDRAYSVKVGYRVLVEDKLSPSVGPLPTPTHEPLKGSLEVKDPKQDKNFDVAGST